MGAFYLMRALRDDERLIPFFERLIPFGGGLFVYSVFGGARGDDKRLGRVVKVGASGWEGLYGSLLCILNAHLRHSSDSERESSVIHQNIQSAKAVQHLDAQIINVICRGNVSLAPTQGRRQILRPLTAPTAGDVCSFSNKSVDDAPADSLQRRGGCAPCELRCSPHRRHGSRQSARWRA
mgnify:CR=1 FL=1